MAPWGLLIRSEVAVPFPSAAPDMEPDVTIRVGAAPPLHASAGRPPPWESAPGVFRLEVEGVARYLVREGREIIVEPAGDDAGAVSTFLTGPVMAACLQQRGIVTLHASAVETPHGAALFAGGSGIGKSVLAAALVQRGFRLMTDDLAAVVIGVDGSPEVLPALPEVRLWADAMEAFGWRQRAEERTRGGLEKYRAPVEEFRDAVLRAHSVFVLGEHNERRVEIEPVPHAGIFESLVAARYGPALAHPAGVRRAHFRTLAAMAKQARFGRVARPYGPLRPGPLADRIERLLQSGQLAEAAHPRSPARVPTTRLAVPSAPGPAPRGGSIVWIASYPKSGNTWLRALLTNYFGDTPGPASINALAGPQIATSRYWFHKYMGAPSSDLAPEELLRLRPVFHERMAADLPRPSFVKVHDACLVTPSGPLFPRAATAGVVYVLRNPCDIAPSLAHHVQCSLGRAVALLNRPDDAAAEQDRDITNLLPESLGTWSRHVTSWLESGLPLHPVRYEDMLTDPAETFGGVLRFLGVEPDPARLEEAVEHSRFGRLQAEERRVGFRGRPPRAPSFFRSGTAGGWRNVLTPEQVRALVDAHGPVMARFGYLEEARRFAALEARGTL